MSACGVPGQALISQSERTCWPKYPLQVFLVINPGSFCNGSELHPDLWFQTKLIQFWKSAPKPTLCLAKILWQFLAFSFFDLAWDLRNVFFNHFGSICILWQVVPWLLFFAVSFQCHQFLVLSHCNDLSVKNWTPFKTDMILDYLEYKFGKLIQQVNIVSTRLINFCDWFLIPVPQNQSMLFSLLLFIPFP